MKKTIVTIIALVLGVPIIVAAGVLTASGRGNGGILSPSLWFLSGSNLIPGVAGTIGSIAFDAAFRSITVAGTSTITGPFTVNGTSTVSGTLAVAGNTSLAGNLAVGTSSAPTETLDVNGYALFKGVYASLSEDTAATTTGSKIFATSTGTFYVWTGASSTISTSSAANYISFVAVSGTTSSVTIGLKGGGVYQVGFSASVMVNSATSTIHCKVFANGVKQTNIAGEITFSTSTEGRDIVGGPGYIYLASSTVIDLRCSNETIAAKTITFNHVNLGITRVSR